MLKKMILMLSLFAVCATPAFCEDDFIEEDFVEEVEENAGEKNEIEIADEMSANALLNYQVEGSLFERITNLEQQKLVIQLEKERAQLDLDLERLNAEKMKLQMEMDTLSGRAEQQQYELQAAKKQLDIQTEKLKRQQEALEEEETEEPVVKSKPKQTTTDVAKKYKLINVVGVDNQLQATIQEVATGQNRRIVVGKELDGYIVKSISLNEGIVFEKDGITETVNIGK